MQSVKEMLVEALDYAGVRTAAADFSDGGVFAMAYRELVNSIRTINAEPRYSFGYQIAKGIVTLPSIEIVGRQPESTGLGLATEHWEGLLTEHGERIVIMLSDTGENDSDANNSKENIFDFDGLVPYRIARVYDSIGDYARSDRSDVIRDRELNRRMGFKQFSFNQDREDSAILELSHMPAGELTVVAEKQIVEPNGYEDSLDMPKNVYKFVLAWLARSMCRRLGNAEMLQLAELEFSSCEKPFLATNERNKREVRINPQIAYARLGGG